MKTFNYFGLTLKCHVYFKKIATDKDGTIWVYRYEPFVRTNKGMWDARWRDGARLRAGAAAQKLHVCTVLEMEKVGDWRRSLRDIDTLVDEYHLLHQGKGKVAPHINCEVRLVLGGDKPLATLEKTKDPYGYALAIALSNTGALSLEQVASGVGEVVFTTPKNKHLIQEWRDLLHSGVSDYGLKGYHYRMGRLYGYSEDDIRSFIESEIDCNCNKCRGM